MSRSSYRQPKQRTARRQGSADLHEGNNTCMGAEERCGPSLQAEDLGPYPLREQASLKVLSQVQSCPQSCILEPLVNQGAP